MEGKSGGMTGAAIDDRGSWDEVGVWLGWDGDGEGAELVAQRCGWCVALTAADQVSRHRSDRVVT